MLTTFSASSTQLDPTLVINTTTIEIAESHHHYKLISRFSHRPIPNRLHRLQDHMHSLSPSIRFIRRRHHARPENNVSDLHARTANLHLHVMAANSQLIEISCSACLKIASIRLFHLFSHPFVGQSVCSRNLWFPILEGQDRREAGRTRWGAVRAAAVGVDVVSRYMPERLCSAANVLVSPRRVRLVEKFGGVSTYGDQNGIWMSRLGRWEIQFVCWMLVWVAEVRLRR